MKALIWIIVILLIGLGAWYMMRKPSTSTTYEPAVEQDGSVSGASTGPEEETVPGEYEDKG
ncbi:MAG: hypothetical protein AAB641_01560 [Patescibacteria group bacterium]